MKRKFLSHTYLKDVEKYIMKYYMNEQDFYMVIKKIELIKKPFIPQPEYHLIDNGYYIVEILPKNEKYTIRIFMNDKKEILEYYFDIVKENALDENLKIPYYDDLYLDITMKDDKFIIWDQDELNEALENNVITKEDYDLSERTKDELLMELKSKKNRFVNMDIKKYIDF